MESSSAVVFDIKRFALRDGPGIRTTIFLKGCPLRCPWCHNPEGIAAGEEFMFRESRCIGCGECGRACPLNIDPRTLPRENEVRGKCLACRECIERCATEALTIVGRRMSVEEVMSCLLKDRDYYGDGGGVTFSGGEPLAQSAFLREMLERCREMKVNTCVETCGYAAADDFETIARAADALIFDVKLVDPDESQKIVGQKSGLMLENLKTAARRAPVIVRIPLIAGITDTDGNIGLIKETLASMKGTGVQLIELLPYHSLGENKYRCLGQTVPMHCSAPDGERRRRIVDILSDTGIPVRMLEI